jgi:hypothetical protein
MYVGRARFNPGRAGNMATTTTTKAGARTQPIETEIWGPNPNNPGYLRLIRTKTVEEYTSEVIEAFRLLTPDVHPSCVGEFEWFDLNAWISYGHADGGISKASKLPQDARVITTISQGNSEGYIVSLDLLQKDAAPVNLISGKCFDKEYAWKAHRQLTELVGIM